MPSTPCHIPRRARNDESPIRFVEGKPYVYQNVFRSLDPVTGRPDVDPERKPGTGKRADFCPNAHGGKNWPPIAFSPQTRMIYVPANTNMCGAMSGAAEVTYQAGQGFTGTQSGGGAPPTVSGADHYGELQAWDPATGKKVWQQNYPKSQLFGSVTATAGDLVLVGGTNDRMFRAYHAKTGELLWQQKTNSGIMGMPVSYEVDGTQYIAVQSGWGVDAQRIQDALATTNNIGVENNVPQGGVVWVFALKK